MKCYLIKTNKKGNKITKSKQSRKMTEAVNHFNLYDIYRGCIHDFHYPKIKWKESNNMNVFDFFYHSAPLVLSLVSAVCFSFSSFIYDVMWCILSIMSLHSSNFSSTFKSSAVCVLMCSYTHRLFHEHGKDFPQECYYSSPNHIFFTKFASLTLISSISIIKVLWLWCFW